MSTVSVFAGEPPASSPSDPLVSTDDFAEWFGITSPTSGDVARMETAIEISSALIRNGRRIFSPVTNEIVLVDAHGGDTLLLPKNRLPVTSVTLVETLNGTTFDAVDAAEYQWSSDGYIERWWQSWADCPRGARVTYSHGYAELPREVAGICLALDNPSGQSVTRETLGDASVEYSAAAGMGLLPEETEALSQYEAIA